VICDLEEVQLTALVDIVPERAVRLADHVVNRGRPRPFTTASLAEALERTAVDAVVVCAPSGAHADIAIPALQSGRHVLIEKALSALTLRTWVEVRLSGRIDGHAPVF
jgi:UDP-N-acetyl-2-amino-2-deoxyglucuronate dehydrogenase